MTSKFRTMGTRRPKSITRAIKPLVEPLENRLLMYRVNGFETFEYLAGDDETIVRVVVSNADVNFVFADVDSHTNDVNLRTGFITPPGEDDEERPGRDLYAVYVRSSEADSYISIAAVPALDAEDRPMLPFEASIGTLRVRNAQDGDLQDLSAPEGTGNVLLGARTRDLEDSDIEGEENIPIVDHTLNGDDRIGGVPETGNGTLAPGFRVGNDNDFGRFLLGGTIIGSVDFTASVETFYAGWILTGDARGISENQASTDNFTVAGDVQNLISKSSIGTDTDSGTTEPGYLTGFSARVRGRIGQVWAQDAILGEIFAIHHRDAPGLRGQIEVEERTSTDGSFTTFEAGNLGDNAAFSNDTFDTPQYLGSFANSKGDQIIRVTGQVQNDTNVASPADPVDYYGIPLMAGQTITYQLESIGGVNVGLYDPDGRLVSSDYDVAGVQTRYTTDRPGVYRLAVGTFGDADFNGGAAGGGGEDDDAFGAIDGVFDYRLRVQDIGDLGIGAVAAGGGYFLRTSDALHLHNGDIGALVAGASLTAQSFDNIYSRNGDLRALQGGTIGSLSEAAASDGPDLLIPRGSVGLVSGDTLVNLNDTSANPIGGDYQLLESGGNFFGNIIANGNIGVVRAAEIAWTNAVPHFSVNADQSGPGGVIDLIDVTGDFGTLTAGGPAIETGPGGNVRYINVGGEVYQDLFFGGGRGFETTYDLGEKVDLIDDSGANFRLTPIPLDRDPNFDPTDSTSDRFIDPGALTVATYGIRDKGGVVLLNVSSTRGVQVDASGQSVEIAQIEANGAGTALIDNPLTGELELPSDLLGQDLDVLLSGSATIDVLNITGGQFTSIINSTPGEIVSANITSVGELRARTLGLAKNSTGAAVNPIDQKSNVYPFLDQRNAIQISESAITIAAERGLGNIIVGSALGQVGGIVQNLYADEDHANVGSVFEGINAPVVVFGELRNVDIGEGVMYSGAGNLAYSGLFVAGELVTLRGRNADIRGDIVSQTRIDQIRLSNGSIINTDVAVMTDFADSREFFTTWTTPDSGEGSFSEPEYEIGGIRISGNGGIIGSLITAYDIGPISVEDGFGILNSRFSTPGIGQVGAMTASGYGIRSVTISGGANMESINATGNGSLVSTRSYSKSVRVSENKTVDPNFGFAPNGSTDLHEFLGTSKRRPKIKNVSKSGVLEALDVRFSRNLGSVDAHVIRGNSSFSVANSIDEFRVRNGVNHVAVRTGRISDLSVGGTAKDSDFRMAGPLGSAVIHGDLNADSSISATGPDGVISDLRITGDALGSIRASTRIDTLDIGKSLTGSLRIDGTSRDATALGNLMIGRNFSGSIDVGGKVKHIEVGRDFGDGPATSEARITGELEELMVGRHFNANLRVRRDIGRLDIDNSVLSDSIITVDRDLDVLVIGDDLQAGSVITVGGKLGSKSIGGAEDGDIVIG